MAKESYYSTTDMFKFIDGLGSYHPSTTRSRLQVLLGYRDVLKRQDDWGCVNRSKTFAYLDEAIKKERRK